MRGLGIYSQIMYHWGTVVDILELGMLAVAFECSLEVALLDMLVDMRAVAFECMLEVALLHMLVDMLAIAFECIL